MRYSNYDNNSYNLSSKNIFESVIEEDKYNALTEGFIDEDSFTTLAEADFSFLPKFRRDPALREFDREAKEAEYLLNSEGINPKTGAAKTFKLIFRFFSILDNVSSIITLATCWTLVGLIVHLFVRAWIWLEEEAEESMAVAQGEKIYTAFCDLAKKEKDPKKKKLYMDKAEEIRKKYEKVDRNRNF